MTVALEVRELLLKENLFAKVINARFAKPLDEAIIEDLVTRHEFIFTLEEGSLEGGFGNAVSEFIRKSSQSKASIKESDSIKRKNFKIYNFGLPCEFITFGKRNELFELYGLLPEQITKKIISIVKKGV